MSLVSVEELRDLVQTPLSDPRLADIISREEQAVIDTFGAHTGPITEVLPRPEGKSLFLRRRLAAVASVSEKTLLSDLADTLLVEGQDYYAWLDEGRLERIAGSWGVAVTVTYTPTDDTPERKAAIIELVRLALERTALKAESVAGEYSYQAADWEAERARILRRLGFMEV